MTTIQKLEYIREAEEMNEERIQHFVTLRKIVSREPINKSSDIRYHIKNSIRYYWRRFREEFPEYIILTAAGIVSMFVFPILALVIWG